MKLVDKMKDENLGLAILYNFTKRVWACSNECL